MVDTHPEFIDAALKRFHGQLAKVGLETGPFTQHLFRSLAALDHPMVCIDAHRAADAIKSRRIPLMSASVAALLESLASIESQIARLDDELDRLARKREITNELAQNCRRVQAARRSPLRRGLSAWVLPHRARKDNPSSSFRQSRRSFTRTFERLGCPYFRSITD